MTATPGTTRPIDRAPLDTIVATDAAGVHAAIAAARAAQPAWGAQSLEERIAAVLAFARAALERHGEIVPILMTETGRSEVECQLAEAFGILDYAYGAAKVARKALAPEKVALSPLLFPGKRGVIELVPRGVVGIVAPWNYPLGNFFKSLFPALMAGNGVVLKPSEHTPRSGAWLAGVAASALPAGLVGLAQGGGDVGSLLIDGVDGVVFTGSVGTGRKVAARAGGRLIPCSVELGGKDAAVVLADCAFERTVAGVANWAMHNAGQNCAAIERVYVEEAIADRFVEALGRAVGRLRVEAGANDGDMGPLQNEMQLRIVERHVAEATAQGARVVCGGHPVGAGNGFAPTVLDGCRAGMAVVDQETFGPVVAVVRVPDAEAAIQQANASVYGLNGSVWTSDLARGEALARRLEVGNALVNNHSFGGIVPQVPWSGTKETGHGIAASRHSYATYTRPRTVIVDGNKDPDPFWLPANEDLKSFARQLRDFSMGSWMALLRLIPLVGRRSKAILANTRP